jgi:hypothetical protein
MNSRLARVLVRLYPRGWRVRYGAEFEALLEEGPGGFVTVLDVMGSALGERAFPTMGEEMMAETSRLETLSARAPWAIFAIAPLCLLALTYFVSLFVLWSGWRMFLPSERTPFVPVSGWAVEYFVVGRVLYFFAPMLVGLFIAWMAARPGIKLLWPVVGMVMVAVLSGAAQVRTKWPSGASSGHVGMVLDFRHLGYAPEVFAISILLYLLLRMRQQRTRMA